jgi:hypothetical protein
VVAWLGVSMHLTADAIADTLEDLRDAAARQYVDAVAPFAAEHGTRHGRRTLPLGASTLCCPAVASTSSSTSASTSGSTLPCGSARTRRALDLSRITYARTRG